MNSLYRSIRFIIWIVDKQRFTTIKFFCNCISHAWNKPMLTLKRMAHKQNKKQNSRQRVSIRLSIWKHLAFANNNFRSHIAWFSQDASICSVRGNIIVVADKDITCLRLDEKVTIVQILITVSIVVQYTKCRNNTNAGFCCCLK